jgi:hypothetical protein
LKNKFFVLADVFIEDRTRDFIGKYQQLKEAAKFKTNKELALKIGIKTVSTISEILGLRQNITPTAYQSFLKFYSDNSVSHETDDTDPKKKHISTREKLKEIGNKKNGIMVYESAPVQAGINTVYHDEHAVPDYVLNIPQFKDCNYGTRASGDSMYPEIRNGDLIICKELPLDARIIFGDIYVIHTKDGIETIKYVQQFTDGTDGQPWVLLVPHNKAAGMGTPIPRLEIIKLFKVRAIFKAY